jgi:hypothetical protein
MANSQKTSVDRRGFLKNAAAGAAVLVTTPPLVEGQQSNGTAAVVSVARYTSPMPPSPSLAVIR